MTCDNRVFHSFDPTTGAFEIYTTDITFTGDYDLRIKASYLDLQASQDFIVTIQEPFAFAYNLNAPYFVYPPRGITIYFKDDFTYTLPKYDYVGNLAKIDVKGKVDSKGSAFIYFD